MTRPPAAALLLTAALAGRAGAQTAPNPDSLPARGGTWAAEAGLGPAVFGGGDVSVGALRFIGARSALTFTVVGNYRSQTSDSTTGVAGSTSRGAGAAATLGGRWYGPARRALAGFGGVGLRGGYDRYSYGEGSALTRTRIGAYGELGAAYVAARRLAVNVSTGLAVVRVGGQDERQVYDPAGDTSSPAVVGVRGWEVGVGGVRLSATLFF